MRLEHYANFLSGRMNDMSAFIIILLLFAAALIGAVLLAVFQKKHRKLWLLSCAALIPAALIALSAVHITFDALPVSNVEQSYSVEAVSQKGYLDMAFALIAQGETMGAERVLNEYAAEYPISDNYLLARARMEAVRKNYAQADGLYRHLTANSSLSSDSFHDEHNEVTLLIKGGGTYQKLFELISRQIGFLRLPDEAVKAAKCYSAVDMMDILGTSSENAKELIEKYEAILSEQPYLFASSTMELSYLKALCIAKEYGKIVERSPYYTDSHSLLTVAELCRTGKIGTSVLKNSEAGAQIHQRNERINHWIKQQKQSTQFSEAQQELIRTAQKMLSQSDISTAKAYKKWIKAQLLTMAESAEEKEASKLYLELARMEFDDDQTEHNSEYIRKALLTAARSEDEAYANAAAAINTILMDQSNTEGLKEIDSHVAVMVENMTAEEMKAGFGTDLTAADKEFADSVANRIENNDAGDRDISGGSEISADNMPMLANDNDLTFGLMDSQYESDDGDDDDDRYEAQQFSRHVTSQVNQITASVNIAAVDASAFETVSLIVSTDESIASNAEEFRKNIEIYDCNEEIKDYQVTKIEDETFHVILVCDNSGSMSGSKIRNLKEALRVFVNHLSDDIKVGIVSFDDSVLKKCSAPLGADKPTLLQAIDQMGDYGGTNIMSGVNAGMDQATVGEALNIMIVMSDGQDTMPDRKTLQELNSLCGQKDAVIYSMGLGSDVDSEVLSAYSKAGGGSYAYVSDSDSLLSFYQYLYGISRNRYKVTYTAKDNLLIRRKAMAVYKKDAKVNDVQSYSVGAADETEEELPDDYVIPLQNLTVNGLDTRMIYQSASDQIVRLTGQNLTKDTELSVSLKAGMSYDLSTEYESDTSWKVTIPASAACGEYDVIVKVNGKRCVFDAGLVIGSHKSNIVRFGDYVFEASNVSRSDNSIRLSGCVKMNGWLGFNSGVTLTGDVNNADSIRLSADRAYIGYDKTNAELNAFGKAMAQSGTVISLPKIEDLTLYRNYGISPSSEDYTTESAYLGSGLTVQSLIELNAPGFRLYPDRMELNFNEFSTAFPLQDQILKSPAFDDIFRFHSSHEETLMLTDKGPECKLEIQSESSDQERFDPVKLGNMSMMANLNDLELKIDTAADNYSLKLAVNLAAIGAGPGLEIAWKGGKLDTLKIGCDFDINTTISGVPVTFSDFMLGATDLSDKGLAGMTMQGSCDISMLKVSAYLPALEKFIGDVELLNFDDTTLSLSLGHRYIGVSTTLKLFDELAELGKADIKLGLSVPYSNPLLGYEEDPLIGLVGSYQKGLKIDASNFKLDIGSGGGVALSDKVIGLNAEGQIKYDIGWWVFKAHDMANGKAFIGMYQKHNGDYVFALIANTNDNSPLNLEWNPKAVIAG